MAKFRIGVLDPIAAEGLDLLKSAGNFEYEERVGLKGDELRKCLAEFDGVIIRSGVKITAESLEGNKRSAGHRPRRRGHRQYRQGGGDAPGHRGHEHSGRQYAVDGRTCVCTDAGPFAQRRPGLPKPVRRQMGSKILHGHPTGRQDAGRGGIRTHWARSRLARIGISHARLGLRSVS